MVLFFRYRRRILAADFPQRERKISSGRFVIVTFSVFSLQVYQGVAGLSLTRAFLVPSVQTPETPETPKSLLLKATWRQTRPRL